MSKLSSILGQLTLPVVSAPMFLVSGVELVVAACESGIIGSFPTTNCRTVEQLEQWLASIVAQREAAERAGRRLAPWAANLVAHSSNSRLAADLALVAKYRAPIVITALGSPREVVAQVHGYGGLVFADINNPVHGRKAAAAGVDGLVLVCSGAGGHTGQIAAPAFVGEVREFWDGPIMLTGAVANGKTIRAYQLLGADLVYIGTSFVAAEESLAATKYKRLLVESCQTDLVTTNAFTGALGSYLRQSIVAAGHDPERLVPKREKMDASSPHGEAKPWKDIWSAGQAVGQIKAIEPLGTIVDRLHDQYREAVKQEFNDIWSQRILTQPTNETEC